MNHRSILMVEDDIEISDALKPALEFDGYAVEVARNGARALDYLRTHLNQLPSLILLDSQMPVMNGSEFVAEQRKDLKLKSIPVILMTAASETPAAVQWVKAQIRKPLDLDLLMAAIEQYSSHQ